MQFPKRITVVTVPYKQVFEFPLEPGQSLGGIEGKLLDTLARALKFEYSLMEPGDGEWGGSFRNGSWTGTIGTLARHEADIAIACISIELEILGADEHRHVMDFSVPYMGIESTFATSMPRSLARTYAYMYPFDATTWMVIFSLLMAIPPLLYMFSRNSYPLLLLETFGNLLGKSAVRTDHRKGYAAFWLLAAMVISQSYVSVLPSFLFAPLREKPVTTFKQLREGISRGEYTACIWKGSGQLTNMLLSKSEDLAIIGKEIERRQWFNEDGVCFKTLSLGHKSAFISDRTYLELEFGRPPDSDLLFATDTLYSYPYAVIGASKTFCCKKRLDITVRRVFESGLMERFLKEEIYMIRNQIFKDPPARSVHMKIDDIRGPVVILFIGHAISTFTLMVELFYGKYFFRK